MKLAGVLVATLAVSAGAAGVTAAETGPGRCFMDADNNGICDYVHGSCSYADVDEDGFCDNCGISIDGKRYGWTDAGDRRVNGTCPQYNEGCEYAGSGTCPQYNEGCEYAGSDTCPQYNEGGRYAGNGNSNGNGNGNGYGNGEGHHGRHHR